jgi:metal-responsive CopG/Arc/MetJ family transcriptional regulator
LPILSLPRESPAWMVVAILWSGVDMKTVQIVLDNKLLQATDRAARRTKRNRSALVREGLREHLQGLEVRSREERDREGYLRQPQPPDESRLWEAEAAWPAE